MWASVRARISWRVIASDVPCGGMRAVARLATGMCVRRIYGIETRRRISTLLFLRPLPCVPLLQVVSPYMHSPFGVCTWAKAAYISFVHVTVTGCIVTLMGWPWCALACATELWLAEPHAHLVVAHTACRGAVALTLPARDHQGRLRVAVWRSYLKNIVLLRPGPLWCLSTTRSQCAARFR